MEILGVILVAILISAAFYYGFNSRGPWGSFWSFFLVLLLIIWAASLWVRPIGPVYWGVAWLPLFFVGLLFALMLAAVPTSTPSNRRTPTNRRTDTTRKTPLTTNDVVGSDDEEVETAATVGAVFWTFLFILIVAVAVGYIA